MLAAAMAEAPGASQLLHGGFVVYTKANKTVVLGMPADLLQTQGAVNLEVAAAMAEGAQIARDVRPERNYGDIGRNAVRACAMKDALLGMQQILAR